MNDVDRLLAHCDAVLGDPKEWLVPTGYPSSLALCVIDSIWSLGVRYTGTVIPVLTRYRNYRKGDADRDSLTDLLQVFNELGGPEGFADKIGTRHRTSTHLGAPLKAAAAHEAALALYDHGVDTVGDLLSTLNEPHPHIERAWRKTPGQRSSDIGWRYLLLLVGVDEVKPDRMICRFVATALREPSVSSTRAAKLLTDAAHKRSWAVRSMDHAAWQYQRRQHRLNG